MSVRVLIPAIIVVAVARPTLFAQDYEPAEAVVKRLSTTAPVAAPQAEDAQAATFTRKLEAYRAQSSAMPPAQAAQAWLALADEGMQPQAPQPDVARSVTSQPAGRFTQLLESLPPPAAWDALSKAIAARPEPQGKDVLPTIGLRLLGHVLIGDEAAQRADLAALDALLKTGLPRDKRQAAERVAELMVGGGDDATASLAQFERALEGVTVNTRYLQVPDLVTLAGRDRAEALLRKALVAPAILQINVGDETKQLAREMALKLVADMKQPQWQLVDVNSVALYEAMEKRFAGPATRQSGGLLAGLLGAGRDAGHEDHDWPREQAERYYLIGLMAESRTDDATRVAKRMQDRGETRALPHDALEMLAAAGRGPEAYAVLHALVSENPDLPLWDEYRSLAARVGRTEEMLATARAAEQREGLAEAQRRRIRFQLYNALLAADEVEEGVAVLRGLLVPVDSSDDDDGMSRLDLATRLVEIGLLLDKPEWRDAGATALEEELAKLKGDDYFNADGVTSLMDAGRGPQAVTLLAQFIARQRAAQAEAAAASEFRHSFGDDSDRKALIELLSLYHRAGRAADVVALLDTVPYWKATDLASFYREEDASETPVGYIAAHALLETGKREQALAILDALLDAEGGNDRAYELRLKAGPDDVVARMDALFARDPFEERPLIWKAHLLQASGKLEEAERVVRQAIAIDPSDGEQGKGDRMRAYAVLADVLAAKGDAKQAAFYREVVTAIRKAERADELYAAGLLKRGVALYKEALNHFQDAYCIQSRLAVQLAEIGLWEEAEKHYRKAYELMPDSFGRMESHCFGCEGAFNGKRAQAIAEQVFQRLLKDQPNKPQVHYLLGYLREQQGRFADALPMYRAAVALDADYLNAWEHIENLGQRMHVPSADRDAATLNLVRLDPLQRHTSPDLTGVRDLRALWAAVEKATAVKQEEPKTLYPLAASAAELAKDKAAKKPDDAEVIEVDHGGRPATPGKAIAQVRVIEAIAMLIADEDE